jgi:hypothetical protein
MHYVFGANPTGYIGRTAEKSKLSSMNHLIELLEDEGLVFPETLEHQLCHELPFKDVVKIGESLEQALVASGKAQNPERKELNPFVFLASSSLRGDSGCSHPECRLGRVDHLGRYAALYSDRILLPLQLHIHCPKGKEDHFRHSLADSIQRILSLRPVIEAGMIRPIPDGLHYCETHLRQAVPEYEQIVAMQRKFYLDNLPRFGVRFLPRGCRHTLVEVEGPPEFLEHGRIIWQYEEPPKWTPQEFLRGNGTTPVSLTPQEIQAADVVEGIFARIANDLFVQQFYGSIYDARYLTDSPGEARFLSAIDEDELAAQRAEATCELTHEIPLFSQLSLDSLVRLRREEPDAFSRYRNALDEIVRAHVQSRGGLTRSDARQIYLDRLRPEIENLESQAKRSRITALKAMGRKTAATGAILGLGLYTKCLTNAGDILKVAGVSLLAGLAEQALSSAQKNPDVVRDSDFYFLLRIKQMSN